MVKYSQGKIYKITSPSSSKIYIGSTTDLLCRRMFRHRNAAKTEFGGSRELIKLGDAVITLIKQVACENKEELLRVERECIDDHIRKGCVILNINSPINTADELKNKTKEKFDCECGVQYTKGKLLQHEESIKHRRFILHKSDNAKMPVIDITPLNMRDNIPTVVINDKEPVNLVDIDFIIEKNCFAKVSCECGGKKFKGNNMRKHIKSKKHTDYLANTHATMSAHTT